MTFLNGLAASGIPAFVPNVKNVTDLDWKYIDGIPYLTWNWSEGQQKVRIAYDEDKPPNHPKERNANRENVNRQGSDSNGMWRIPFGNTRELFICIYTFVERNAAPYYSSGISIVVEKPMIEYKLSIKRAYIYGGLVDAKLILTVYPLLLRIPDDQKHCISSIPIQERLEFSNATGTAFQRGKCPTLVVVKKSRDKPVHRTDGRKIENIPAQAGRNIVVPLGEYDLEKNTYIGIFVKEEKIKQYYDIKPLDLEESHLYFRKPSLRQLFLVIVRFIFRIQPLRTNL